MKCQINTLIEGGIICDGRGQEPFEGDLGISGDRIVFVNKKMPFAKGKKRVTAEHTIQADGMMVVPGFIDTHAHSEFTLLADPRAEGKVFQGITTEINGNCGLSAAPLYGEALKRRDEDIREYGIGERWNDFEEYFRLLQRRGIFINYATLAGHGNLRACITGYADRKPKVSEMGKMRMLLRQSIKQGAIGLSTGLIYPPGLYAATEELTDLAGACKKLIYTSHMRSEGDALLESIDETVRIGKESGIRVHISHIKTSGQKNWHKIDDAITRIEKAREEGIRITCDRYPYTAASTDLDTVLPDWVYEGGTEEELRRLSHPQTRDRIKKEILSEHPARDYWDTIYISSLPSGNNRWMEGKSLARVSQRTETEPADMLLDILIQEKARAGAIFASMSDDNLVRFLQLPYLMIGTDSSARSADGLTCKGKPHPRGFGSFPRFIGSYVRDNSLMSLSCAIQKITMLPAQTFRLHERGVLRKGAIADIVVFDFKKIIDRATFEKPFSKSKGIGHVIVNGKPVLWEGRFTGVRAGKILRHGR